MPISLKNAVIFAGGFGPVAMVITVKSSPPNVDCSVDRFGISFRQGAHHVAQKLSKTTLPR